MKNWLKRFGAWVIASRNKLVGGDLFATARFKIIFWYAVVGLIILAVAGALVYTYLITTIQHTVATIQSLLFSPHAINDQATSAAITNSINADLEKMSVVVGGWIVFTMVLSAYVLSEIILWPIRRAMSRQKRFIADVSHELRTPLSVMRMTTEVALMEYPLEGSPTGEERPHAHELVEAMRNNLEEVDRMTRVTQFLLDFSNPERRRATYERAPVDVTEVAHTTTKSMLPLAAGKNITLTFLEPAERIAVLGNTTAIGELLTNLIKNAVAYTPQGGSVSVHISRTGRRWGDSVTLSVKDTGIGIPPEDLPNIFEPFYRAMNARRDGSSTNSGLGLAIVRDIAEMHGATIATKSEVGKGTSISISFPAFSRKLHN